MEAPARASDDELLLLEDFVGRYLNQRRSVRPVDVCFRSLFLGDGTISVVQTSPETLQIGWADGYRQVEPGSSFEIQPRLTPVGLVRHVCLCLGERWRNPRRILVLHRWLLQTCRRTK
jgi:hypothetical protein